MTVDTSGEKLFLTCVQANPINRQILQLAPQLGLSDWWLTAGALFQTVWNVLEGKDPQNGIRDYDFFYFDEDTSYEAEDAVIRRAKELFKDIDAEIEVRNEARVHIWYEEHFGVPAIPFASVTDAIDHFAAKTCCFAVTSDANGQISTYAPYGFADLFARRIIPNPVLAPRNVYEAKTKRWLSQWPSLTAEPWPERKPSTDTAED
ncbi:nucleotidyltransferase family protein [Glutamicibacter halophytocola]|uniref:Nucleotidyltransferase family protein n=1 Tax=Glutamicibacter halophytocola TaxID=1933880 RepID=A0ABX5Y5K2_9MICC|nr:nucleotidyltransferase family protein [Glutamicibacter halophytocola]QDY65379.1 nucleotidyltransferase family protein [Glutamicibacter halophytocola]